MAKRPTTTELLDAIVDLRDGMAAALTDLRSTMLERFEAIDRRFDEHDRRFDAIDRRLGRIETRVEDLEQRAV